VPTELEIKLLSSREKFQARIEGSRAGPMRNFYENTMFYVDHQWIEFNHLSGHFQRPPLRKSAPMPVTNIYKSVLGRVDAELSRVEPSLSFAPGSNRDNDRTAADGAKIVIGHVEDLIQLDRHRPELSKGVCLMNNMYTLMGWDFDGGRVDSVPVMVCVKGGEPWAPEEAEKVGGKCPIHKSPLEPSSSEVPRGTPYLEVLTPFEVWVDPTIKHIDDQPMIMVRRLKSLTWVQNKYPGKAKRDAQYMVPSDVGMTYLQSIIRIATGSTLNRGSGATVFDNSEIVDDLYIMPCREYKRGATARFAGCNEVLEAKPELATHDGNPEKRGRPFIPVVHWGFDDVPGCHYKTGPADSLKAPQRNRNRVQASVELYFARTANGIIAMPQGSDLKTFPGEEGSIIEFNKDLGEPKRLEGGRLPNSFSQRFQQIDDEMMRIAGIEEVLTGAAPGRVDSGYAMNILQQRAQTRFAALYFGWEQSYQELARQAFLIFRNNAPDISFFAIKGEEARWQMAQVKAADLYGSVDIRVEAGSAQPKTQLQKRAAYEQAMQMGLVDINDPRVRLTVIRALQVHELMDDTHADDDVVAREHGMVIDYTKQHFSPEGELLTPIDQLPPFPVIVDPLVDNSEFHYGRHSTWMKSEEFRTLPPPVQNMMRIHLQETVMQVQVKMMSQQAAAPTGGAGGQQSGDTTGAKNENASARGGGAAGRSERQQVAAA